MQARRLLFALPTLGRWRRGRPAADPADVSGGPQPLPNPRPGRLRFRLPSLGPRVLGGLLAGLLVLLPGLLAAEAIVWAYEARLTEDARSRALAGLDSVTGLVDAERTRALNNADLAAVRLGATVSQGNSQGAAPDELVKTTAELRAALRTTLVAPLAGDGKTLASDPASNLPFGTTWEARQALGGRSVVVLQERNPGLAIQAAAPLRVNGEIVPGAVVVAQHLEDGFLNTALRLTGLDLALVQPAPANAANQSARLVAASRGIRRSFSFATDQSIDPDLLVSGADRFKRTRLGNETFYLAARTISNGPREVGTVLVGQSADAVTEAVRSARTRTYGGALLGGLLAVLLGIRLGAWQAQRIATLAGRVRALSADPPHPPAAAQSTAPAQSGPWADLDRAVSDATVAVARRAEEQQLRAVRLEAVLGSLAEGVIVADEQHRVVFANPVARRLLQLPSGPADSLPPLPVAVDRPTTDGPTIDGPTSSAASQRVIRSYSAPVLGQAGVGFGFVTVLRDATHEQEVERDRSEMLGVVSHELQTPLTAIKGALELVVEEDEGQLSRVQRRFLDTIDRNCARMIGLVGDLLDLSRLDAGKLALDSRPLDAESVIAGSVTALANLFEQRRQEVRILVAPGTPPLLGDRRRVEQMLTNLLSNAARYAPEGGAIEVTAAAENGSVQLAVADSGPGIPEAERELVFGRFYRGKDAGRSGEAGSGLGLAIVKSLVELHGGTVQVAPPAAGSAARGARFVVELPRAPDDE